MYCPYCGREMAMIDGVFTCDAGDMPLSTAMHATLTERFPTHRPRPAGVEVGRRLTRWFCPGCGVPLDAEMTCAAGASATNCSGSSSCTRTRMNTDLVRPQMVHTRRSSSAAGKISAGSPSRTASRFFRREPVAIHERRCDGRET